MKTGASKAVAKIQSSPAQISSALVVDEKLDAVALDHCVSGLLFVQRHLVMQTGAAAFHDLHAQTFSGALLLGIEQVAELTRRVLGDVNHRLENTARDWLSQKRAASRGVKMLRRIN